MASDSEGLRRLFSTELLWAFLVENGFRFGRVTTIKIFYNIRKIVVENGFRFGRVTTLRYCIDADKEFKKLKMASDSEGLRQKFDLNE